MSFFNTLVPSFTRSPARASQASEAAPEPTLKPAYEVKENDDAYGVTVYLPGVTKENLEITAEEGHLHILGRRSWKQPEGWTLVYRESADLPFELMLDHENRIDADKIVADLRDGVLRISLPKHEAVKPRKIAVS